MDVSHLEGDPMDSIDVSNICPLLNYSINLCRSIELQCSSMNTSVRYVCWFWSGLGVVRGCSHSASEVVLVVVTESDCDVQKYH